MFFVLGPLLIGCAVSAPTPTTQTLPAEAGVFREMVKHLAEPQMEGRGPGTPAIDRARDWIIMQLRATGLSPAFGDSYTQTFDLATAARQVRAKLTIDGRQPRGEIRALGISASGNFSGQAVFAGYGVGDVPKGVLRDKVCIIYRFEPGVEERQTLASDIVRKVAWAEEQGAAAAIIVNPPTRPAAALPTTYGSTYGGAGNIPAMIADYAALKNILSDVGEEIKPLGVTVAGEVELDVERAATDNIAILMPGRGEQADERIVIGAHYDHLGYGPFGSRRRKHAIHPGADDNASGVAMLIMLARNLSQQHLPPNRPAILFIAFSGEERGRIGSQHFVQHLDEAGLSAERIIAMINLDMVGRLRKDTLLVSGSFDHWPQQLDSAAELAGLTLRRTHEGAGPSDHAPFIEIGIPAVHFFTGVHEDYHTPRDTADKINPTGAVKILDMIEQFVLELAGQP